MYQNTKCLDFYYEIIFRRLKELKEQLRIARNNRKMEWSSLKELSMKSIIENVERFATATAHQHQVDKLRK
jgi:hypothetical protein